MYNEEVREPQVTISSPDPCDHYEATVTPMCGSTRGVQTSPVKMGGEGLSTWHIIIHEVWYLIVVSD